MCILRNLCRGLRVMSKRGWHMKKGVIVAGLLLGSNLDVTVNRFSPLATQYIIQTLFRPFEPTLDISATVRRSTVPTSSQLVGAAALTQLNHIYAIGYGQTLQTGTRLDVSFGINRNSSNSVFSTFNPSYSGNITYAVFCSKKKKTRRSTTPAPRSSAPHRLNLSATN